MRTVQGSLVAVCAAALAITGIGWHVEQRSVEPAPETVFCDINALTQYHPASRQLRQAAKLQEVLRTSDAPVMSAVEVEPVALTEVPSFTLPDGQAEMRARLEEKAEEQLAKVRKHSVALLRAGLGEKRKELEARVQVNEVEIGRRVERDVTVGLRSLDEEHQFERVDAGIKLAALKAQLASSAADADRVKAAIESKEKELADVRDKLSRDQEDLKAKAALVVAQARKQNKAEIEYELSQIEERESQRIDRSIRDQQERLHRDLRNGGHAWQDGERAGVRSLNADIGLQRAAEAGSKARSGFKSSAARPAGELIAMEASLRKRIKVEIEAVVRRIARDNGLRVTFVSSGGARDGTEWFRERLPYSEVRRSG
ncbi:MAG: hypothetical protein HYX78_12035 [Armatimonadetes bacterium]|nr:hypothetical protein [Armatimonadota bacterium]